MKLFSTTFFTLFLILLTQTYCQTPYDPTKDYNFTYLDIPINLDPLQLCLVPSADRTICLKCIANLSVTYIQTNVHICVIPFPVDNCYAFNYVINCILCHDGWWLNQTIYDMNRCVPKTRGCQTYNSIDQKCVTCLPGWTMNTSVNSYSLLTEQYCYFTLDANCAKYDTNNTCLQCATNYLLSNNTCIYSIPNCDTLSSTKCTKCKTNYQLDTQNNCVSIPPVLNCALQIDFTCQACVAGFKLVANQCVFVIENCAKVNELVCAQCNSGYYVTVDGKCALIPRVLNCDTQVNFTCTKCLSGYFLTNDGQCVLIPRIHNCDVQVDFTCTKCLSGYFLSTDGQCLLIPHVPNCDVQLDFTCSQCASGYNVTVDGKCAIHPIINCEIQVGFTCNQCVVGYYIADDSKCAQIHPIANCEVQSGFACSKCVTGFSLTSDGQCVPIPHIPNCDIQSDFTCIQCATGYALSNNICIVIIPNCIEIAGTVCTKCATGYLLSVNGRCEGIAKIQNCLLQVSTNCTRCLTGYDLINNLCVYHVDKCQTVSGTTCTQCIDGYSLTPVGKCTPFDPFANFDANCRLYDNSVYNKCLTCLGGFFINGKGFCQQVDPLCKTYNTLNGLCLSCYVGFTLDQTTGKCLMLSTVASQTNNCNQFDYVQNICLKCADGCYFDSLGKCQKFTDTYCKTPSTDLKSCTECYTGYNYDTVQGKCIVGNFNCATWSNGKCATCPQGYFMDDGSICTMVDQYCKIFSQHLKKCILCYSGYWVDIDNKCKEISVLSSTSQKNTVNCATFNNNGQCTSCYYGYYVAQDTTGNYCVKVSELCKAYTKTTGKCISCYLGYYLSTQGDCLKFF